MKIVYFCPNCSHHEYINKSYQNNYECTCCGWDGEHEELVPRIKTNPNIVLELLYGLTNDERDELFSNFCRNCGSSDSSCHCCNDW